MRYILFTIAFALALSACGKVTTTNGFSALGGGTGGSEKTLGPGAARNLNTLEYPNIQNQIWGKWSMTEPFTDANGGTYHAKMFFSPTEIGLAMDCQVNGYDVTASLSVSVLVENESTIEVPAAGRKDAKSSDGEFTCTATIDVGTITYKLNSPNYLTLTDTRTGTQRTLVRLNF